MSSTCAGTIPRSEKSVSQGNVLYVNTEKVPNFEKTLISLQWLEGLPKLETSLIIFYNIVQAKSRRRESCQAENCQSSALPDSVKWLWEVTTP